MQRNMSLVDGPITVSSEAGFKGGHADTAISAYNSRGQSASPTSGPFDRPLPFPARATDGPHGFRTGTLDVLHSGVAVSLALFIQRQGAVEFIDVGQR